MTANLAAWFEERDHKRMKKWMQEVDWSTSICADPAEIFELLQTYGDEADLNQLEKDYQ